MSNPSGAPANPWLALAQRLDRFAELCGRLFAWLIVPMVLSLVYEVFARYLFSAPTIWAYDMTFILYGSHFMLGAAYTLMKKGHIRTDSYYMNWSARRQGWTDTACYLLFFFPAMAVFTWLAWQYFGKSWDQGERLVTSPWMPIVYPFKFVMFAAGALLLVQGVSETIKSVHAGLTGRWPDGRTGGPSDAPAP